MNTKQQLFKQITGYEEPSNMHLQGPGDEDLLQSAKNGDFEYIMKALKDYPVYYYFDDENGNNTVLEIKHSLGDVALAQVTQAVIDYIKCDNAEAIYDSLKKNEDKMIQLHNFNYLLMQELNALLGEHQNFTWKPNELVAAETEEILKLSEHDAAVEITAKEEVRYGTTSLRIAGYNLAVAKSKNSGAFLSKNVAKINGEIKSGGSNKYWFTCCTKGSTFRLKVNKRFFLENYNQEQWEFKFL
ncbi:MAG TPA: hypothetical protein PLM85_09515 [Nitrosomonas sp.]|nr:hypothetical protein [Nitrosomonas sp.]